MNISPHDLYMNIAKEIAKASHAERNKVGAILVKDHNIIAFGYNGTPHGFDNTCEHQIPSRHSDNQTELATKPEVLHAESNAIAKCARSTHSCDGATLYVTVSPCLECAKLIIQAGIKHVLYLTKYRIEDGIQLLYAAKIQCNELAENI